MNENKKPKWYQPYSTFRKVLWWLTFSYITMITLLVMITNDLDLASKHIALVIWNLIICIISYSSTFEPKKEEDL